MLEPKCPQSARRNSLCHNGASSNKKHYHSTDLKKQLAIVRQNKNSSVRPGSPLPLVTRVMAMGSPIYPCLFDTSPRPKGANQTGVVDFTRHHHMQTTINELWKRHRRPRMFRQWWLIGGTSECNGEPGASNWRQQANDHCNGITYA